MALVHTNTIVPTTAVRLVVMPGGIQLTPVSITNNHNQPIYLGADATVTAVATPATVGNALAAGATVQLWLNANDVVWAVAGTSTVTALISVLYSGI